MENTALFDLIMSYETQLRSVTPVGSYNKHDDKLKQTFAAMGNEISKLSSLDMATAYGHVQHHLNPIIGWWRMEAADSGKKVTNVSFSDRAQQLVDGIREEENIDPELRRLMIEDALTEMRAQRNERENNQY